MNRVKICAVLSTDSNVRRQIRWTFTSFTEIFRGKETAWKASDESALGPLQHVKLEMRQKSI